MLKKPEWIDGVIARIEPEIIKADDMQKEYMTLKKKKTATTKDYVDIIATIDHFYKGQSNSSNFALGMGYQGLAASSWHGRRAIKEMEKRLKNGSGIITKDVIEFRDMTGIFKKGQIEKLRQDALKLLLASHPHQNITGEELTGEPEFVQSKKNDPERARTKRVVQNWRINQLNALIDSIYREPLQADVPTAESLVKKINNEQKRVFNEEYNNYLNAMTSFNALKYVPYYKKGEKATFAEYERVRNAPVEAYGAELSELGRALIPALARAQASMDGLAICDRLTLQGTYEPSKLEAFCQHQIDDIRTALSSKAVQGVHGGRPMQSKAEFVERVIDLYKCRPLKDISTITIDQAIADFDSLVKTGFQDGM